MSEHAPGPWRVNHSLDGIVDAAGDLIGVAFHTKNGGGEVRPDDEVEANARMMAASTQLLEACESALVHLPYQQYFGDLREQLKAAIAKAKGATNEQVPHEV